MNTEQVIKIAIEKGFIYNPETGNIYGVRGNLIINKDNQGYIKIKIDGKYIRGHQLAWYYYYREMPDCLDHINGIRDDNRIVNLRNVTKQKNSWNRTKAKGYSWYKPTKKWRARIGINNRKIYLGCFEKEEDARQAYLEAKKIYHII